MDESPQRKTDHNKRLAEGLTLTDSKTKQKSFPLQNVDFDYNSFKKIRVLLVQKGNYYCIYLLQLEKSLHTKLELSLCISCGGEKQNNEH